MTSLEQYRNETINKIKWRIVPFAFLLYFFNGMDRANVGFAALEMNKMLHISAVMFGTISSAFFISYLIFQIPSNLTLERIGVNRLIPTLTIGWGCISALTFLCQTGPQVAVFRFLLGVFEAGFFPGMIFYFAFWFPARERAQVTSLFFLSGPVSMLVVSPISGWIVQHHFLGFAGWRWLFVVEGVPTIILGLLAYVILKNSPRDVKWLAPEEKDWLMAELARERAAKQSIGRLSFTKVISDGKLWRLGFIYFFIQAASQSAMFWMPGLVKGFSATFSDTTVGMLLMIPSIVGLITVPIWGTHSDRTGERKHHASIPMLLTGLSFLLFIGGGNVWIKIIGLVVYGFLWDYFGTYWILPTKILAPEVLAVGIALINSLSALAGFLGNLSVGYIARAAGSTGVFLFLAALSIASYLLMVTMKVTRDTPKASTGLPAGQSM